jgi:hypothetical protein
MAFPKAVQNVDPEAHAVYVQALMEYKASCALDIKYRKIYKKSTNPQERLKYHDFHEQHSLVCQAFYKARDEYAKAHVIATFKAKNIDISALSLAQIAGIQVPMSMKDIMAHNAQDKAMAEIEANPEMKRLYDELVKDNYKTEKAVKKEPASTKAKFMTGTEQDPFSGDFEF